MSSLLQIIGQLRDNQTTFNTKLARVESLGRNVNKALLRDLIQDARELHEGSVILSYLLFDEYTKKSEQAQLQEKTALPKDVESITTETYGVDENSVQKETLKKSEDLNSQYLNPTNSEIPTHEEIVDNLEDEILSFISDSSSNPLFLNQEEEDNSLAAKLARKKIQNLSNGIGINEKFLFTNELFDGNTEHFLKTIDELDNCVSLTEANKKLLDVAQKRSWILEEEPYLKLQSLLSRKYQ
jgi:hypothetical protein